MSERAAIPKSIRFEVFKRDSFTCQYCGRKAPEVVLNCDHIDPVAKGGTNAVLNLITACFDCNSGKGARTLDERHILNKQRSQLDDLNERRVQLEMLADWQRQMMASDDHAVSVLEQRWGEIASWPDGLTEHGRDVLRKLLRRYSPEEILQAMAASCASYAERGEDGEITHASVGKAFNYIGRVASTRRAQIDKPYLQRLLYIRGILRRRLSYLRERNCLELMEEAVACDIDLDWLEGFAKRVSSWSAFRGSLEDFIAEHGASE
jgi:hypothetical protein